MSCTTNINELTSDECRHLMLMLVLGIARGALARDDTGQIQIDELQMNEFAMSILPKLRKMAREAEKHEAMRKRLESYAKEKRQNPNP